MRSLTSDRALGKRSPLGVAPTRAKGTDAFDDVRAPDEDVGATPLAEVGTSPVSAANTPVPDEFAPLPPAAPVVHVPVAAVSRVFGVGICNPARAGAMRADAGGLTDAAGTDWVPASAAPAATTLPVAIAAVSIRNWVGDDFRACFDMPGSVNSLRRAGWSSQLPHLCHVIVSAVRYASCRRKLEGAVPVKICQ
ncbi:hypothetical protein MNO81_14965 [Mycolicibacterium gadium]|uniref:Uncharacterized protein n=1 Tax=Mycolicibacterium gadium TaxID=1794 RepID=A0ABT6GS80_MYCGU|nr:hypothetical protein [Mycolicibacterium gadium]